MQDIAAQVIREFRTEVGELHVAVLPSDGDFEPSSAKQPRNQRPGQVDALHSIEAGFAITAKDKAAAHVNDFSGHAKGMRAPGQVEDHQNHQQHASDDEQSPPGCSALVDGIDRIAAVILFADEQVDEAFAQVRDDETDDGHHENAAAQQRCRRVEAVPFAIGEIGARRGEGRPCASNRFLVHSPARRLSASSTSRSRRLSASASARPGIDTPALAAAVTNLRSARPSQRATGPRVMSMSCMRP